MKSTDNYYHNGLTRKEYETDKARLDGFNPVESDWKEIFRWVISCGEKIAFTGNTGEYGIAKVWYNHVLTVLVEIARKDMKEYKSSFIDGYDTSQQYVYILDLYDKFKRWINRLDQYILERRKEGVPEKASEMRAALQIKQRLEEGLPIHGIQNEQTSDENINKRTYYQMINAMTAIHHHCDQYIDMIEEGGYMDGALSLLLTYVRNYCRIVTPFNHRMDTLPDLYRKHILQAIPEAVVPDSTFLIVQPAKGIREFILPKNRAFSAGTNDDGTELVYRTFQNEPITPLVLEEMNSVFLRKKDKNKSALYKQPINLTHPHTVTRLFCEEGEVKRLMCGWMVESDLLKLEEGLRKVTISFRLTEETSPRLHADNMNFMRNGFSVWLSDAEGWTRENHTEKAEMINGTMFLTFSFTIGKDAASPVGCIEETHHINTRYPSVRILVENPDCPYELATQIHFDGLWMGVEVSDIQNFSLYNDLGEVDTTQPFYPFGTQAGQGAWFMFGSQEMNLKPLTEVRLDGKWKKLPPNGYTEIYKAYPYSPAITENSFHIQTEYQENGKWYSSQEKPERLFQQNISDHKTVSKDASIRLNFRQLEAMDSYGYACECSGFFRVTLQEPAIGFGMEVYRDLFAQTMIYNSHHKEKKQKEIPSAPVIPMMADSTLSYKACRVMELRDQENTGIRLSEITPLSDYESYPIDSGKEPPHFLPEIKDGHQLYWGFSHADGVKSIQAYVDLAFVKENIFRQHPDKVSPPILVWEYLTVNEWKEIPSDAIIREETNGFTQSGFIKINLPVTVQAGADERFWIRTRFQGDVRQCLAVRNVWLNCIQVIADGGNGLPLPEGTIQEMMEDDGRIASINQSLSGFGGKPVETTEGNSVRQSYRIANRQRAVLPGDFESLLLQQFPEVEKACCIPVNAEDSAQEVKVIVFCRTEENPFFITPAWKLAVMKRTLSAYTSPFMVLQVINPIYCQVNIYCRATLKSTLADKEKISGQIKYIITNYLAPWIRKRSIPEPGQSFSCKGLHSRIANHEDICTMKDLKLVYNGKTIDYKEGEDTYLSMDSPWFIPVPNEIGIGLLPPSGGIDEAEIGKDFIIV